jgi:hypothetical protein
VLKTNEIKRVEQLIRKLHLLRDEVEKHDIKVMDGFRYTVDSPSDLPETPPKIEKMDIEVLSKTSEKKKKARPLKMQDKLMQVVDTIRAQPNSYPFHDPVGDIVGYDNLIKEKMDLTTIAKLIDDKV